MSFGCRFDALSFIALRLVGGVWVYVGWFMVSGYRGRIFCSTCRLSEAARAECYAGDGVKGGFPRVAYAYLTFFEAAQSCFY